MGKSNLSAFGSFDKDAAARAQAEIDSEGSGGYFKFKEGKNRIRILPPPAGFSDPFRKVFTHYVVVKGEKGEQTMALVCPKRTKIRDKDGNLVKSGEDCAICAAAEDLEATGNPLDKNKAYSYRAQARIYVNVLDRKDPTQTVKILGLAPTVYKELVALREGDGDEDDPGVDFTHPLEGYDVSVVREGTDKSTKYTVRLANKPSPIVADDDGEPDFDAMEEIGSSLPNLDKQAALPTDDVIRAALKGKDSRRLGKGGDDEDDEDFGKSRKRLPSGDKEARRSQRRKPKDEDVIDAEFEDDDDLPEGM